MRLIPNAMIYAAELPKADFLAECLVARAFTPILKTQAVSYGFVPVSATGDIVSEFPGGLAFSLRIDSKNLPLSGIKRAQAEALEEEVERRNGDLPTDEEQTAIFDQVFNTMLAHAPVSTTVVTSYYAIEKGYLIVPVASKGTADLVTGQLLRALGSLKTSTINVSTIRQGLTERLRKKLGGDEEAFDGFDMGEFVLLKGVDEAKRDKLRVDMVDLDEAGTGILEAIDRGMIVDQMELVRNGVTLKLTDKFRLRGIRFNADLDEDEQSEREDMDGSQLFLLEAGAQVLQLVSVIDGLCELFSWQRPEELPEQKYTDKTVDVVAEAAAWLGLNPGASADELAIQFDVDAHKAQELFDAAVTHNAQAAFPLSPGESQ